MVFLPRFSPHKRWKMAENSLYTRGSLLSLLNFVDVLRNCPCAKARRPFQNCNPSRGRCSNTVDAHNTVIREANRDNLPRSTSGRFRARMGLPPHALIPLIVKPTERTDDDNELATTASPATQHHIRRVQRQCRTHSTSPGASRVGVEVAMSCEPCLLCTAPTPSLRWSCHTWFPQ